MEIVMFIVMLLLGSLFNSGKKKHKPEEKKQAKPFTARQKEQDNPIKKLKEMSRDLYKEIQQEFEEEQAQPKQQPTTTQQTLAREFVEKIEVKKKEESTPKVKRVEKKKPAEVAQLKNVARQKKKPKRKKPLVPTSSDDMMRGIIFSEIIGPPKSKR